MSDRVSRERKEMDKLNPEAGDPTMDAGEETIAEPGRNEDRPAQPEHKQADSPESEAKDSFPQEGTDSEESLKESPDRKASDNSQEPLEAGEKKKSFFAKKKDKKDEQIEDLTDRLKRNMAEFDNYRKRTEKEKAAMYEIGARDMIEKILLVVDNFERGLATIPEGEERGAFAEGMDKIYKQLLKMLEDVGVTSIEAVGRPFDPNYHNAVMHIEDESLGENVVAEEFQKGYLYRDNVVRHSMVKVAN